MRIELVTPPADEPITLAEAKLQLRVDEDLTDEDDLITALISAARGMVEAEIGRALVTQTWDLYLDGWPFGGGYYHRAIREMGPGPGWLPGFGGVPIEIPRPPLQSVPSVSYVDTDGTPQTLPPSAYEVSIGTPGRIVPTWGTTWPTTRNQLDAVTIRFVAGYGSAAAVPAAAKVAMKLLLTHLFENRGEADVPIPSAVKAVLSAVDWGAYG